jgi:protein-L-isoaspartate(D-aspartate) O-methyltransferase
MASFAQTPHVRAVRWYASHVRTRRRHLRQSGATRPADVWLDRLKEGGTADPAADSGWSSEPRCATRGSVPDRATRPGIFCAPDLWARDLSLEGGRDEPSEQVLAAAFDKGGAERVTRLYRRDDLPEDQCWLRPPGWCLAYR